MTNEGGDEKSFPKNKQTITKTMPPKPMPTPDSKVPLAKKSECEAEPACRDPTISIVGQTRADRVRDRNTKCPNKVDQTTKTNKNCTDARSYDNADPNKRCTADKNGNLDFKCYSESQNSQTIHQTIHRPPKQSSRYGDVLTGINTTDNRTQGNKEKELPKLDADYDSDDTPPKGESEACATGVTVCNSTDDFLRSPDFETLSDFNKNLNNVATEVVKAQTIQHPECAALSTNCTKSCSDMTSRIECRKNRHQCTFEDKLVCTQSIQTKQVCLDESNQEVTLTEGQTCSGKNRLVRMDTIEPCQGNVCRLNDGTKRLRGDEGQPIDASGCNVLGGTIAKEDFGICALDTRCTKFQTIDGTNASTPDKETIYTDANGNKVNDSQAYTTKTIKRKVKTQCFTTSTGGTGRECPGDEAKKGIMRIESDDGNPFHVMVSRRKEAGGRFYPPTIEAKPGNDNFGTCTYIDDKTTLDLASNCCTLQLGKDSQLSKDVTKKMNDEEEKRYKRMVVGSSTAAVVPTARAAARLQRPRDPLQERGGPPQRLHTL